MQARWREVQSCPCCLPCTLCVTRWSLGKDGSVEIVLLEHPNTWEEGAGLQGAALPCLRTKISSFSLHCSSSPWDSEVQAGCDPGRDPPQAEEEWWLG